MKSKGAKDVNVNFAKPCAGCKMRQQTVSVGKSKGLDKAEKIGAAVARRHENCHQTVSAPAPNPEAAFLQSQEKALDPEKLWLLGSRGRQGAATLV